MKTRRPPRIAGLFGALLAVAPGLAAAADVQGDRLLGIWATDRAEAHVEVSRGGDGKYYGTIIWLEEPFYAANDSGGMAGQPKVDRENPDPALRDRGIDGLRIMDGFGYAGNDTWTGGSIYDPENGKTYKCRIHLTEEGTLKVRGYVGIPLFGRTTEWTPVLSYSTAMH